MKNIRCQYGELFRNGNNIKPRHAAADYDAFDLMPPLLRSRQRHADVFYRCRRFADAFCHCRLISGAARQHTANTHGNTSAMAVCVESVAVTHGHTATTTYAYTVMPLSRLPFSCRHTASRLLRQRLRAAYLSAVRCRRFDFDIAMIGQ